MTFVWIMTKLSLNHFLGGNIFRLFKTLWLFGTIGQDLEYQIFIYRFLKSYANPFSVLMTLIGHSKQCFVEHQIFV